MYLFEIFLAIFMSHETRVNPIATVSNYSRMAYGLPYGEMNRQLDHTDSELQDEVQPQHSRTMLRVSALSQTLRISKYTLVAMV